MTTSGMNLLKAFGIAALGIAIAIGGVYVGDVDDAPGASVIAILLALGALVWASRIARRKT